MTPTDQVVEAMARLDPETRALLELSSRRHVSDEEIADLLRLEPAAIAERRQQAEERFGRELGLPDENPDKLRARLDATDWSNGHVRAGKRASRRTLGLGVIALAAAVAVVLMIALGSGGKTHKSQPPSVQSKPKTPTTSAGPVRTMERLNSTHGHGTAQLLRSGGRARVRLRLSGFLAPSGGGYSVWLFNSQSNARRLYATANTTIETDLRLPSDYGRFKFVDVARAVPNLNSPHGGLSLLRVSIAGLR